MEKVPYINGSPQNTFVPCVIELAEKYDSFIGGDDFKSGQTKIKSVLAQFLVDAGIKPLSMLLIITWVTMTVTIYHHQNNLDLRKFPNNLLLMILLNPTNYCNKESGDKVDHCIVIKYLPAVGDSKVAMDEYYSELCWVVTTK